MRKIAVLLTVLFCMMVAFTQAQQVKGKVIDSKDGSPLSSISVKIKNTNEGVSTDPDGSFSLDIKGASAILEFSGVGYGLKVLKLQVGR
ncbi:MAG: carboxypeptidase-like regulatory domain-containing protein [Ferruginibacter sp.]